jgi:hypothetical protein
MDVRTTQDRVVAAQASVDPTGWQMTFESVMARIAGRFTRVEPRRTARAFVTGLLAGLPRMNHLGAGGPSVLGYRHCDRANRAGVGRADSVDSERVSASVCCLGDHYQRQADRKP